MYFVDCGWLLLHCSFLRGLITHLFSSPSILLLYEPCFAWSIFHSKQHCFSLKYDAFAQCTKACQQCSFVSAVICHPHDKPVHQYGKQVNLPNQTFLQLKVFTVGFLFLKLHVHNGDACTCSMCSSVKTAELPVTILLHDLVGCLPCTTSVNLYRTFKYPHLYPSFMCACCLLLHKVHLNLLAAVFFFLLLSPHEEMCWCHSLLV